MKPLLETSRLKLVPFDITETGLLYQTLTDPYVKKYLMDDAVISHDTAEAFIQLNEQHFTDGNWGLWKLLLKEQDIYAGFAGLWNFFDEAQPQLLYALLPAYAGKGYATEASQAVLGYAFSRLDFRYVVASFDTPNLASRKVCERLGMKETAEKEINDHPITFYRLDR